MSEFKEKKIKLVVKSSNCCSYKPGDAIYIDHSMIDKEKSGNICPDGVVSYLSLHICGKKTCDSGSRWALVKCVFQCPDIEERVEFSIIQYDED